MGCELFRENLSAYLDRELSAPARKETSEHLKSCEGCRAELKRLRGVRSVLHALPEVKAPADFLFKLNAKIDARSASLWQQVTGSLFQYLERAPLRAMSAAAGVVLLVMVVVSQQGGQKVIEIVKNPDGAPKMTLPETLASNTNALPVEFASTNPHSSPEPIYLESPNDLIFRIVRADSSFRHLPIYAHPQGHGVLIDTSDSLLEVTLDPNEFPFIQSSLEQNGGRIPQTLREATQIYPIYVRVLPSPMKPVTP